MCKTVFSMQVVENTFTSHYPKDIIVPVGKVKRKVGKESEAGKESEVDKESEKEM